MKSLLLFAAAAVCEIAGCFSFWSWLRSGKSAWWAVPGVLCLILFAVILTRTGSDFAGRAYAAYGGIYILSSILWLRLVEGVRPDRWDMIGGLVCLTGACLILFGPRPS